MHNLDAIERALVNTRIFIQFSRSHRVIRTLSNIDGDLNGSYCRVANHEISRSHLEFNVNLSWIGYEPRPSWIGQGSVGRGKKGVNGDNLGLGGCSAVWESPVAPITPAAGGDASSIDGQAHERSQMQMWQRQSTYDLRSDARERIEREALLCGKLSSIWATRQTAGANGKPGRSFMRQGRGVSHSVKRRILWAPPLSGMGDQLNALITMFWLSLLSRRRLELVPGTEGVITTSLLGLAGAKVELTSRRNGLMAMLADAKLSLAQNRSKLEANNNAASIHACMHMGDSECHKGALQRMVNMALGNLPDVVLNRVNVGDQTAAFLRSGFVSAATLHSAFHPKWIQMDPTSRDHGDNVVPLFSNATTLSACVLHALARPVDPRHFNELKSRIDRHAEIFALKVASSAKSNTQDGAVASSKLPPRICLQIRTGHLADLRGGGPSSSSKDFLRLLDADKHANKSQTSGQRLKEDCKKQKNLAACKRAGAATRALLRPADAEMLGLQLQPNLTTMDVVSFLNCARDIEADLGQQAQYFISTDSDSLRRSFCDYQSQKIVTSNWPPVHTSMVSAGEQEALQMLAEWSVLAHHCDHLIVSVSSFGLTAAEVAQSFGHASVVVQRNGRSSHGQTPSTQCTVNSQLPNITEMPWLMHALA